MGLLGDLEQRFLQPILDRILKWLGPFGKLVNYLKRVFEGWTNAYSKGLDLTAAIRIEINEWKNFKEAVPVRTGVISLPRAIEKSQDLLNQIRDAWAAIVDLFKQIQKQAQGQTEDPTAEAEDAVAELERGGGKISELLGKFPKLAKGLERVLGFLALIIAVLETLVATIDDLTAIVAAIRGIREEIETGSTIFLGKSNPRKIVRLADGTTMKIRVGNLHPA